MRWRGNTTRRMSVFPDAETPPLAPTEDALQKEMETGMSVSRCQTIKTGANNREILVSHLVRDRGAKPGQGPC